MSYHASRMPATLTTQPEIGANMPTLASHCSYSVCSVGKGSLSSVTFTFSDIRMLTRLMVSGIWCNITRFLSLPALGTLDGLMVLLASGMVTYWLFLVLSLNLWAAPENFQRYY